jgi:antitoxin HigA-1
MTTKSSAKEAVRKLTGHISFGDMLWALRLSEKLSQVEMAKKLEISKQDLCNIEKNRKLVSIERAISFAKSLKHPWKTFAVYAIQDQLYKAGVVCKVDIDPTA